MTSVPGPEPKPSAGQIIAPLRELAAVVLVGANALLLFVALIDLLIPVSGGPVFSSRVGGAFFDFVGLTAIVLPLVAVLLATIPQPPVGRAKLITQAAAVEYAVSAVFAVISFLVWMVNSLADLAFRALFTGVLVRTAFLTVFGIAAFAVYRVWRTLYYAPRPKREPGVYGRPQPNPYGGLPPTPPWEQPSQPPRPPWEQPGPAEPYASPSDPYAQVSQPNPYGRPPSPYGHDFGGTGYGQPPSPQFGGNVEATQVVPAPGPSTPPGPPTPPTVVAPPPPPPMPPLPPPGEATPGSAESAAPSSAPPASAHSSAPASSPPGSSAAASSPPGSSAAASSPPGSSAAADPAATQVVSTGDLAASPASAPAPASASPAPPESADPTTSDDGGDSGAERTQVIPRPSAGADDSEATQMIIGDQGVRRPEGGSDQQ
ncbi:hypothetical protein [Plantactinospora sp. GCM10030261]|uniref:hypothetical protein n=1 Tax=Plantactinospora sp. GCM10030261 TaxID=3273420 RepID=UPI003611C85F